MMLDEIFTRFSVEKLTQSAQRIDVCLSKLTDEQVWARGSVVENAIGNLTLHLCGNVGLWIVSAIGGAPDTRDRDAEFAAQGGISIPNLRHQLSAAVQEACDVIRSLPAARLEEQIQIREYNATVLEAVYHVVEHFSGHTYQIMFATKMLTAEDLGFYRAPAKSLR